MFYRTLTLIFMYMYIVFMELVLCESVQHIIEYNYIRSRASTFILFIPIIIVKIYLLVGGAAMIPVYVCFLKSPSQWRIYLQQNPTYIKVQCLLSSYFLTIKRFETNMGHLTVIYSQNTQCS